MGRHQSKSNAVVADDCGGLVEGALVLTLTGAVAVEALQPGDRIVTRSGARRLLSTEARTVARARVVRIAASALGPERPDEDILIAPAQPILIRDWRAKALVGTERALIPAASLCDGEYIREEARRDVRIFTLHFEAHEVVYAQGLELACEPAKVTA